MSVPWAPAALAAFIMSVPWAPAALAAFVMSVPWAPAALAVFAYGCFEVVGGWMERRRGYASCQRQARHVVGIGMHPSPTSL